MGKIWFLILSVFTVSSLQGEAEVTLDLTQKEQRYLQKTDSLKVSNEMDWAPFDYVKDGKPAGYSIGLMELVSKRLGVEFEYVNGLQWPRLLKRFRQKKIDIMSAINYTDERTAYALFTKPYFRNNIAVFSADNTDIASMSDLRAKKVALPRQYSILDTLNKEVEGLIHVPVADTEEAIKAVSSGRADFTVESAPMVQHKIASLGIDNVRINFFPEFDYGKNRDIHLRSAVHRENPVLFSIVQKALDSITREEKLALKEKWQPSSMSVASIRQKTSQTLRFLTKKQKDYLRDNDTVRFCADPRWMPYEALGKEGAHKGMAADIANIFGSELGIAFTLVPTRSWSQSLEFLKERKCDLSFMVQPTADRQEYLDFTSAYFSFPFVVATKTDTLFIDDISQHLDKTYGIVKDYGTKFKLRQSYPTIKLKSYEDIQTGLQALQKDEIGGFIDTTNTIGYVLNAESIASIKIGGRLPVYYRVSVATRNDRPMLRSVMQKAVDALDPAEKDRIYNRWVAVVHQKQYDYSLIWKLLLGVAIIVAAVLYSNRRLRKAKKETAAALTQLQQTQKELEQSNKQLRRLAVTDHLTGLFNRLRLDALLNQEFSRAKRYGRVFGVILLDLDDFKDVNDEKGHQVGDEVLKETARLLQDRSRESDIVGRWGGEEFLIICPETDTEGIIHAANHLCTQLGRYRFGWVTRQTGSFGAAVYQEGDSLVTLLARADKALYKAKEGGKNKVEFC